MHMHARTRIHAYMYICACIHALTYTTFYIDGPKCLKFTTLLVRLVAVFNQLRRFVKEEIRLYECQHLQELWDSYPVRHNALKAGVPVSAKEWLVNLRLRGETDLLSAYAYLRDTVLVNQILELLASKLHDMHTHAFVLELWRGIRTRYVDRYIKKSIDERRELCKLLSFKVTSVCKMPDTSPSSDPRGDALMEAQLRADGQLAQAPHELNSAAKLNDVILAANCGTPAAKAVALTVLRAAMEPAAPAGGIALDDAGDSVQLLSGSPRAPKRNSPRTKK